MNEARLLRILRLPLITLLAINLAVLLIAPLYRTRQTPGPRSTEQAASSVPEPAPIAPTKDDSASDQDAGKSSSIAAERVVDEDHAETGKRATALTEPAALTQGADTQETIEWGRERSAIDASYGLDWRPRIIAQQPSLPKSAVEPFSRPIARAAGRLSQWLAAPPRSDSIAPESAEGEHFSTSPTASRFVAETSKLPSDRIVLRNPHGNRLRVAFLLDEQVQMLEPGAELVLDSVRANIRFDRGSDYGESRLVLEPGVYRFAVGRQGWRLQSEEASGD
jgi:hypothetical protein